jgi:predicted ATPase/DNA-binding CsgD family transcriptional regulator/Tfp pilus assembly protein PilF
MSSSNGFQTSLAESGGRLPPHHSELIGRENEIAAIVALLRDQSARLISLTGPGGVGKTRLGVAVADRAVGMFPGGTWFVSLAALDTPGLVLPEIASALGARDAAGEELLIRIGERMGTLPALIILDNLEHVISVSPEIARMLQVVPNLTVLTTTREPLMVRGEIAYPVHPLATESSNSGVVSAAEQLFITRASESSYGFEVTEESRAVIREICRRLGGIPLAIELAATWVKVLPPQRLLDNLDRQLDVLVRGARDLPPRQRTMRSAIEWSYQLLTPEQQGLFRALSVFGGEFTLTDAEAVAQEWSDYGAPAEIIVDPWRSLQTLEGLSSLVSKSLVIARTEVVDPTEPQYELLETIRAFGLEQLREVGEEADARRRFSHWFAGLAEQWGPQLMSPERRKRLAQYDLEYPNFRAALNWAVESGDIESGLRLIVGLWRYWDWRGHLNEGSMWCERVLALEGNVSPELKVRALYAAATLPFTRGDYQLARKRALECLEIAESFGDAIGIGYGANALGNVYYDTGDYQQAAEAYARGLEMRRLAGARSDLKVSIVNLAFVHVQMGSYEEATPLFDEALTILRDDGDSSGTAWALNGLGLMAYRQGDLETAAGHYQEAIDLQREEDTGQLANALDGLAAVRREQGDLLTALALDKESLDIRVAREEKGGISESLAGLAYIAARSGQPEIASTLLGAVESLRNRIGLGVPESARTKEVDTLAELRASLGEAAFGVARSRGLRLLPADAAQLGASLQVVAQPVAKPRVEVKSTDLRGLTSRELEVLRLIVEGKTDRQIADELFISSGTASRHVANILHKLDVKSRSAAAAWAIRHDVT